jgi:hypothetical protein
MNTFFNFIKVIVWWLILCVTLGSTFFPKPLPITQAVLVLIVFFILAIIMVFR